MIERFPAFVTILGNAIEIQVDENLTSVGTIINLETRLLNVLLLLANLIKLEKTSVSPLRGRGRETIGWTSPICEGSEYRD